MKKGGKIDLDKIYIRANINNKWESVSLKNLLDMKEEKQIWYWFLNKILFKLNMKEGYKITEENVKKMVLFLEKNKKVNL